MKLKLWPRKHEKDTVESVVREGMSPLVARCWKLMDQLTLALDALDSIACALEAPPEIRERAREATVAIRADVLHDVMKNQ